MLVGDRIGEVRYVVGIEGSGKLKIRKLNKHRPSVEQGCADGRVYLVPQYTHASGL